MKNLRAYFFKFSDKVNVSKKFEIFRKSLTHSANGYSEISPVNFAASINQITQNKGKCKIVAIYVHGKSYRSEVTRLYKMLEQTKEIIPICLVGERLHDDVERLSKSFLLSPCDLFARELRDIDLVITTALMSVYHLPQDVKKLYLIHDINDSSLGDLGHQRDLLAHYDVIATAGPATEKLFRSVIGEIPVIKSKTGKINIKTVGYPKIDRLTKYRYVAKFKRFIICPTMPLKEWEEFNLNKSDLKALLIEINRRFAGFEVIFRPHPHTPSNDPTLLYFRKAIDDVSFPNLRLEIDESVDYVGLYSRSLAMITDFSGTASTFMTAFRRPAFYFLPRGFPRDTGPTTQAMSEKLSLRKGTAMELVDSLIYFTTNFDIHWESHFQEYESALISTQLNSMEELRKVIEEVTQ